MSAFGIIGLGTTAARTTTTSDTTLMAVRTVYRAITVQSSAWTEDQGNTASRTR